MSDQPLTSEKSLTKKRLLELTDQCVKCGQCLSTCPTYRLKVNEADSPRGRVTLIQGLLNKQISANDTKLFQHLDSCLECGNCETACPSGVHFTDLLDQVKNRYSLSRVPQWQLTALSSGRFVSIASKFSKFVPQSISGLIPGIAGQSLALKTGTTGKINFTDSVPENAKGKIGIFTGCVGQVVDADVINITCQLIEKLGYAVLIPAGQGCCGAIHQHEGFAHEADSFAENNISQFNRHSLDAIIYFASGCGIQLLKQKDRFNAPLIEATAFLSGLSLPEPDSTNHLRIAIHSPCTLRNSTDAWPVMLELVRKLAGEQLVELAENHICCGNAGLHQLKYPETAAQLMQPKLESLRQLKPDILLTANTGCALHFRNSVQRAGLDVQIMHPAEWVARQVL